LSTDIRGAFAAGGRVPVSDPRGEQGIALLEAMTAGKAVVVRDIETFSWLDDGEDCLKSIRRRGRRDRGVRRRDTPPV